MTLPHSPGMCDSVASRPSDACRPLLSPPYVNPGRGCYERERSKLLAKYRPGRDFHRFLLGTFRFSRPRLEFLWLLGSGQGSNPSLSIYAKRISRPSHKQQVEKVGGSSSPAAKFQKAFLLSLLCPKFAPPDQSHYYSEIEIKGFRRCCRVSCVQEMKDGTTLSVCLSVSQLGFSPHPEVTARDIQVHHGNRVGAGDSRIPRPGRTTTNSELLESLSRKVVSAQGKFGKEYARTG